MVTGDTLLLVILLWTQVQQMRVISAPISALNGCCFLAETSPK